MISNVGSQHVKNPVSLTTENIAIGNSRVVIALHVDEGRDKPYFGKDGVIWLKEGADKRRVASKEEIRRLFESSASLHADEQPTRAKLDQLDMLRFRSFFEKDYGLPLPTDAAELLRTVTNMNLATDDGHLNLAGLMMFGRHPEFLVPQFSVKAVRVNGNDMAFTSYLDREDFAGTIPDMYAGAMSFVMRNMHKTQRAESVNMPGESEIPRVVFEEIIVNALVHRNYFVDAPIRILIFDDRVEIVSPGSLPNHLTVEKMLSGNTNIRNPIIASYVARGLLPYWGLGSGIRRVKSAWSKIQFIDDKDGVQFRVVVHKASSEQNPVGVSNGGINETINGDDGIKAVDEGIKPGEGGIKAANEGIKPGNEGMSEGLKSIVLSHPGIRVPQLATHLRRSRQTIERYVADLKRQGIIEYRGSKKTGGYYVKERF
jgi:ATP-dependent DNA helicase RecG